MTTVKALKKKVKVTQGTHKITTAMKLVSASRINKYQDDLIELNKFIEEQDDLIHMVLALNKDFSHPVFKKSESEHGLILAISSEKGLCGGYNLSLSNMIVSFIGADNDKFKVGYSGSKAYDCLQNKVCVYKKFDISTCKDLEERSKKVAEDLYQQFISNEVGTVFIAYNDSAGTYTYKPCIKKILPFDINDEKIKAIRNKIHDDFIYEPNVETIMNKIVNELYYLIFYSAYLSAAMAECLARMVAMDNACKSCEDIIQRLNLQINKVRQASITKELMEIISGTESM